MGMGTASYVQDPKTALGSSLSKSTLETCYPWCYRDSRIANLQKRPNNLEFSSSHFLALGSKQDLIPNPK